MWQIVGIGIIIFIAWWVTKGREIRSAFHMPPKGYTIDYQQMMFDAVQMGKYEAYRRNIRGMYDVPIPPKKEPPVNTVKTNGYKRFEDFTKEEKEAWWARIKASAEKYEKEQAIKEEEIKKQWKEFDEKRAKEKQLREQQEQQKQQEQQLKEKDGD